MKKKTTVSPGGFIKKSFWFRPDEARRLRKEAYEQETSQAELVRRAVRLYFGMDEPRDPSELLGQELRSDPAFRDELREFLREHSNTPEHADEILALLEERGHRKDNGE